MRLWSTLAIGSLLLLVLVLPQSTGWMLGIFVAGFVAFSAGTALYKRQQLSLDLRDGVMACVEGSITLNILTNNRGGVGYRLEVEGYKFSISKETFLSLSNHQSYRVYYAPHLKIFLYAEPL